MPRMENVIKNSICTALNQRKSTGDFIVPSRQRSDSVSTNASKRGNDQLESTSDDEKKEPTKRKRGWPKGKPRNPPSNY